ncbi:unnamed protein product [Withania somnifera]
MSSCCCNIRHIVKLRKMLQCWRKKASTLTSRGRVPSDVSSGHIAVIVGDNCKRYVIRVTYLNHPMFKKLLSQAEEQYGFANSGPLAIPCDESLFEELLLYLARFHSLSNNNMASIKKCFEDFQRCFYTNVRTNLEFWGDSRPLLHSLTNKST